MARHLTYRREPLYSLPTALTENVLSDRSYRKTAVIISDSIFRHVREIEGGDIWYQGGHQFWTLVRDVRKLHGSMSDFKYNIFSFGTNESKEPESEWDFSVIQSFLKPLENHPHTVVVFNTPIALPKWEKCGHKVTAYGEAFLKWFDETYRDDRKDNDPKKKGIYVANFKVLDWTTPGEGNFFLPKKGAPDDR